MAGRSGWRRSGRSRTGVVKSNQITVDVTDYPNLVDDNLPQTVMWGIPNEDIVYRESANKGGEITGLYEYSSSSGKYLAATSGGVLYKETQNEMTLPSTDVSIRRRILTGRVVGPFLSNDADQTRSMSATNITDGTVPVVTITNNGDGNSNSVGVDGRSISCICAVRISTGGGIERKSVSPFQSYQMVEKRFGDIAVYFVHHFDYQRDCYFSTS